MVLPVIQGHQNNGRYNQQGSADGDGRALDK
jgi:hypothetical protein